jgi:hypothetical protein
MVVAMGAGTAGTTGTTEAPLVVMNKRGEDRTMSQEKVPYFYNATIAIYNLMESVLSFAQIKNNFSQTIFWGF